MFDNSFYSPWRIRRILMAMKRPVETLHSRAFEEIADPGNRKPGPRDQDWMIERICERVDVWRALQFLDWFTRDSLLLTFVFDRSNAEAARLLKCHRETIIIHKEKGLNLMAEILGYSGPAEHHERSPEVWRHPDVEKQRANQVEVIEIPLLAD